MLDARCEVCDIEGREKFTVGDRLIPIRPDERAGSIFSQVIERQTLLLPEPHFWHVQPIIDLKPIDTATGNHHLDHQVWQGLVGTNAVALVRFCPTPSVLLPKGRGAFGVVGSICCQEIQQQRTSDTV